MPPELKAAFVQALVEWMPQLVEAFAVCIIALLTHGAVMKRNARRAVEGVERDFPNWPRAERERIARGRVRKTIAGKLSGETGAYVAVVRAKEKLDRKKKPK